MMGTMCPFGQDRPTMDTMGPLGQARPTMDTMGPFNETILSMKQYYQFCSVQLY